MHVLLITISICIRSFVGRSKRKKQKFERALKIQILYRKYVEHEIKLDSCT